MRKNLFTREQVLEIAKTLSPIRFSIDPKTKETIVLEYESVDPFDQSCIWDEPKPTHKVVVEHIALSVEAEHSYGAPNLFKPSLAEVIFAMPPQLVGIANAFTIHPDGFTDDNSHHKSIVTFYRIGKEQEAAKTPPSPLQVNKYNHILGMTVRSLMYDGILNGDCLVSIDMVIPGSGEQQTQFLGFLKSTPDYLLDCGFCPIQNTGVGDNDVIHIVIN